MQLAWPPETTEHKLGWEHLLFGCMQQGLHQSTASLPAEGEAGVWSGRVGRSWEWQSLGWSGGLECSLSQPQGARPRHGGRQVVLEKLLPPLIWGSHGPESGPNLPQRPWVAMHRVPAVFWRSCPHLVPI